MSTTSNQKAQPREDPDNAEGEWGTVLSHKATPTKAGLHMFSPTIASLINEKQPDVAAAALFYNLSLWQKNKYQQTLIDGRRYAFRSLTELAGDCPYLSRSAVAKAITRMETAFGDDFRVKRDKKTLWFSISDKLLSKQRKNTLISFFKDEAVEYKGIRTASILNNARYAFQIFKDVKTDASGHKYIPIRSGTLARYLPFSEDSISRSLTRLCDEPGPLIRHPELRNFFAVRTDDPPAVQTENVKNQVADVHAISAEVDEATAEVHVTSAEVHDYAGTDSNQCVNEYVKGDINDKINSRQATPPRVCSVGSSVSPGLKELVALSEDFVKNLKELPGKPKTATRVSSSQLPYDVITPTLPRSLDRTRACHDLPYDVIYIEERFAEQLKDRVDAMTLHWNLNKFPYDQEDVKTLKRFFTDNFTLPEDILLNLWKDVYELQHGNILGPPHKPRKGKFDPERFARKARTAKAFLKYLPKIVYQRFMEYNWEDGELVTKDLIPAPYSEINYDYLGRKPTGSFLPSSFLPIPVVLVSDDEQQDADH